MLREIWFAILLTAALGGQNAYAAEYEIKMLDNGSEGLYVFEPGFLKVSKDDTVKFTAVHPGHNTVSLHFPDGGPNWQSAISEETRVTFDKEGVYIYKCQFHLILGMVGIIQVGEPVNLGAAKQAAAELTSMFFKGKDRLNKYMTQVE